MTSEMLDRNTQGTFFFYYSLWYEWRGLVVIYVLNYNSKYFSLRKTIETVNAKYKANVGGFKTIALSMDCVWVQYTVSQSRFVGAYSLVHTIK